MAQRIRRIAGHCLPTGSVSCGDAAPGQAPCAGSPNPAPNGELLKGIRVVELATVIAAPTACAQLADLGAEVIKVESPTNPDMSRNWGINDDPRCTADTKLQKEVKARQGGGGSAYVQINRGKKSILVDFQKPEGARVVKELIATADVFVTNIRLQGLQKVGLDYETIHKEFPRLIYGHFTAFGREGPKVNDPGYDYGAFWANTGIGDLIRSCEQSSSVRVPPGFGDNAAAVQFAGHIGLALYHREMTGEGQLVDATLFRSGLQAITMALLLNLAGHPMGICQGPRHFRSSQRMGDRSTLIASAYFRTKDKVLLQLLGEDAPRHIPRTLKAIGASTQDLFGLDPPLDLSKVSIDQWKEATRRVDGIFASKTYEEWRPILKKYDVWHVVVQRFEDIMNDEQVKATGMLVDVPGLQHPLLHSPIFMGADKGIPTRSAPSFGEHTEEVLGSLGYSTKDQEDLRKAGVVR